MMLRELLLGVSVAALAAGCQIGATERPGVDRAQLAAHAATAQFPEAEAEEDLRVAAIIDRENNRLRLINYSDQPLRNVDVWVNAAYVSRVASIPPRGTVSLRTGEFYDQTGRSLAEQDISITRVQIAYNEQLYNAWGPAQE